MASFRRNTKLRLECLISFKVQEQTKFIRLVQFLAEEKNIEINHAAMALMFSLLMSGLRKSRASEYSSGGERGREEFSQKRL